MRILGFLLLFSSLFSEEAAVEQPLAQFGNDASFFSKDTANKSAIKNSGEEKLIFILYAKDANIARDPLDPNGKILKLYGVSPHVVCINKEKGSPIENMGSCIVSQFQSIWQKTFMQKNMGGKIVYILEENLAQNSEFFHQTVQIKELHFHTLAQRISCKLSGAGATSLHLGDLGPTTLCIGEGSSFGIK